MQIDFSKTINCFLQGFVFLFNFVRRNVIQVANIILWYTYHNNKFSLTDIEDATKTPNCSSEPVKEERGDLIKFYNTIYVGRVKSFALKYDLSNQDHIVSFKK